MDFLHKLSLTAWIILAGFCGAIVGLVIHTEIRTFWQRVFFVLGGVLTAFFFAEPIGAYLALTEPKSIGAVGFTLGIFGMSLLQRVKVTVENVDIAAILKARWRDILGVFRVGGNR